MKKRFLFYFSLLLSIIFVHAQPCLTGWRYRVPVAINNLAGTAQSQYQAKLTTATQTLVANGKMNIDGSDIRFLTRTGSVLPYWIENGTMNTTNSIFWIRLPSIAAATTDTIFLFYGNNAAAAASNGVATFDFFDDFDGSNFDTAKWTSCTGGNIAVSNSRATFTSTSNTLTGKAILASNSTINNTAIIEAYVSTLTGSGSFIGTYNASVGNKRGYTLYHQIVAATSTMRMRLLNQPDACGNQIDQTPSANTFPTVNNLGVWSISWLNTGSQLIDWVGATSHPTLQTDNSYAIGANRHIFLGNAELAGSMSVDWIRARKYTTTPPLLSTGLETAFLTNLVVSNSSQTCVGGDVQLNVNGLVGALYQWTRPLGFNSTLQNPSLTGIALNQAGVYQVSVTIPGNCAIYTGNTVVTVNTLSIGGNTASNAQICTGTNTGIITLTGASGGIQRWESSTSGQEPWNTITQNQTTLSFLNLTQSIYYRAVIKNGACVEAYSTPTHIEVAPVSKGGKIFGAVPGCESFNTGTLVLSNHIGDVVRWQSSIDNFSTTSNINTTSESYIYTNLPRTISYRVEVQSGTCPIVFSDPVLITIYPKPKASFIGSEVCKGNQTSLINNSSISSGFLVSYTWDFGDGNGSPNRNAKYAYASAGDFLVKLYISSDKACLDSVNTIIRVNPIPTVLFSQTNVCDKDPMSFSNSSSILTGSIVANNWFFDVFSTSTNPNPVTTFPGPGNFSIKLVLTSDKNCKDSLSKTVTVFPRTEVDFDVTNECIGNPNVFTNKTIAPSTGSVAYTWNFGDGTSSRQTNPSHLYTVSGMFPVTLFAVTSNNCSNDKTKTAEVFAGPVANFTFQNVCQDYKAMFTNTSSVSSGTLSYMWNFGDGQTSTDKDPENKYASSGSFPVSLTTKTQFNCSVTTIQTIVIYPEPKSNFTFVEACDKDSLFFNNQSVISSGNLSYVWKMGDNTSQFTQNVGYVYPNAGTFNVRLIATSPFACVDSIDKVVTVFPLPKPKFDAPTVCHQSKTIFTNQTTIAVGKILNYTWNFADGTNSIDENPTKTFAIPKIYQVTLLAISNKGCRKDTTQPVEVKANPVADFFVANICGGEKAFFNNNSDINPIERLMYKWNYGDSTAIDSVPNPEHLYAKFGRYFPKLIAISEFGCKDSLQKQLNVYGQPSVDAGKDTSVSQGYGIELQAKGAVRYVWYPFESLTGSSTASPLARPFETTVFTVVGTDEFGCKNQDEIKIEVIKDYKLFASNVMTPDGNGQNDTWYIENIETFKQVTVAVYDRKGKKVYAKQAYQNDWEGTDGFDILPDGTYYYVITFDDNPKTYKGALTILRNKN